MFKFLTLSLILAAVLFTSAVAQITINNNFQPVPGTVIESRIDTLADSAFYSSMVSGTGGPMVWNFSGRTYAGAHLLTVLSPGSTPSIDSFPDANLVLQSITGSDTGWVIYRSDPNVFAREGIVEHAPSGGFIHVYRNNAPDYVFPISYNNQWICYHHWTQYGSHTHTDVLDTVYVTANAWGTAQYRTNSVACLRLMNDERLTDNTYDSTGHLIYSYVSEIFSANFISAGFNILASVSKSGQPPFVTYSSSASADFVGGISDVRDNGTLPDKFEISQNYPNPFNPTTTIQYDLPIASNVAIDIYDILGNKVETLINSEQQPGHHEVVWDARDEASGIYFYKIQAGSFVESKRMTLLK